MPDPTLNRRVAEALGWEVVERKNAIGDGTHLVAYDNEGRASYPWRPSTNMADAIAALEEFTKSNGLLWAVGPFDGRPDDGGYCCEIGDSLGLERRAATLPEAICKAILAAKEARDG